MREWSVKSAKRRVENPRVVHYGYEQVFIRQAWCTDRPHSFCEPTHFHPLKKMNEYNEKGVGGRNLFEKVSENFEKE